MAEHRCRGTPTASGLGKGVGRRCGYLYFYVPRTYVPDGTIGLVEAKDGKVRPPGQRLGRYVGCDYFQGGVAFLLGGGEQGRQLGYLPGGGYYNINTELFNVITKETVGRQPQSELTEDDLDEVKISVGNTGVVIVLDGRAPGREPGRAPDAVGRVVAGHHNYRLPWVFLDGGGQRGVQEETLEWCPPADGPVRSWIRAGDGTHRPERSYR